MFALSADDVHAILRKAREAPVPWCIFYTVAEGSGVGHLRNCYADVGDGARSVGGCG